MSHSVTASCGQRFKKLDKDLTGPSLFIFAVLVGDRRPLLLQYRHCVPFQSPPLQPRFPLLLALRQSVGFSRSRRRGFLHLKVSHVAQRHPNYGTFSCCRPSVCRWGEKTEQLMSPKMCGLLLLFRNTPIHNNTYLDETSSCLMRILILTTNVVWNLTLVTTWDGLRLGWRVMNIYLSIPLVQEWHNSVMTWQ